MSNPAIVQGATWRLTVLTDRLIRIEQDPAGRFADLPSQAVRTRSFPSVPDYTVTEKDDVLTLRTDAVTLILKTSCPFSPATLSIQYRTGEIWRYGDRADNPYDKLRGTVRTLDGVNGEIPLPPSLMTRFDFSELDDSHTLLRREDGSYVHRGENTVDLFVFGYARRYRELLQVFYQLTGAVPLLPRYAMGNMWSRYYSYKQDEYLELMDRFLEEGIPLTVGVVDMGWHLEGWTGYTWDPACFPDYKAFLREMHDRDLEVTLNLHPANGVAPYEAMYKEMAEAVHQTDGARILFDLTDPVFRKAYFDILHHPYERDGVTFWWIDWQQGPYSRVEGLDPLYLLNEAHREDMEEQGKRPFMLSRYCGPGAHRYPAGFSGDTVVTWESLRFQPYFTACASNVGFSWWSHDIGGHMGGVRDDELAVRWVQFGVFSPIMRLHSTSHPLMGKEPWNFGTQACEVMKKYLKLRSDLIPYLYTMNERASRGKPLTEPLCHLWPDDQQTYKTNYRNEYVFGSQLLISPITEKTSPVTGMASVDTYLPEGRWYDFFTGYEYRGGQTVRMCRSLSGMPVLVREGGILPLDGEEVHHGTYNPSSLVVHVFPGREGSFSLYEDDGKTLAYQEGHSIVTRLSQSCTDKLVFTISSPEGDSALQVPDRCWTIVFRHRKPVMPRVLENGKEKAYLFYDTEQDGFSISLERVNGRVEIIFDTVPEILPNDTMTDMLELVRRFQGSHNLKQTLYDLLVGGATSLQVLSTLYKEKADPALTDALMELLCLKTGEKR